MLNKASRVGIGSLISLLVAVGFVLMSAVIVISVNRVMRYQALVEAEAKARILLDRNLATHTYFSHDMKPNLFEWTEPFRSDDYFDPTWMSSTYAVRHIDQYFKSLSDADYYYKEAAINARSPENEADAYERTFLDWLNADPDLVIDTSVRVLDGKPYFVVMRRGEVMEESCLRCHSEPDVAPRGMVQVYGADRSFDRQVGEVIDAIAIRIPLAAAYAAADRLALNLSLFLLTCLVVLFTAQFLLTRRVLFAPLAVMRDEALLIARGIRPLGAQIPLPFGREFAELSGAFNTLSTSLARSHHELEDRVTERTEQLDESNREYRWLLESMSSAFVIFHSVFDDTGKFVSFRFEYINRAYEQITGVRNDEVRGKTVHEVWPATEPGWIEKCGSVALTGVTQEFDMYHAPTNKRYQCCVYRPWDTTDRFCVVFEDITERVKMEAELQRAQKLESVGRLAGGIAHDFNNLLTSILGNVALARAEIQQGNGQQDVLDMLADAETASVRAQALTQQLLTFSSGGAPVKTPLSIVDLLQESAMFVLQGSNVHSRITAPKNLWPVEADKGQVSQAINNLLTNARQAMPSRGAVTIGAENYVVTDDTPTLAAGRYVQVTIADEGTGIPEEHLPRIFDPFFTTKQTGSGLGLSSAYSIIKSHGGHITAESTVGRGTTFRICLPASERGAITPVPEKSGGAAQGGRVLIMDDEDAVRALLGRMLTRAGYDVAQAADGTEAIELYQHAFASAAPFDVVILDLTVPGGMGGIETLHALREIDPQVRAIVSSGYSTDATMSDLRTHGFAAVVPKPYQPEQLRQAVHTVIHRNTTC